MRIAIARAVLLGSGLALLLAALLTALAAPVGAAPRLLITETPTSEPPTRTSTSPPAPPATATSTPIGPTNTAVPTSTSIPPTDVPDDGDDDGDDDSPPPTSTATATTTPIPEFADPAITKAASITDAHVGDTVEFTISAINRGNATATDVIIEDTLPSFLALDSVSATRGDVSVSGTTVRVVIGDLAPGEEVSVTVTARVIASSAAPNNRNIATVSTTSDTDDPSNNSSSVALLIQQPSPTAAPPASLPNTSDPGSPLLPMLVALGLALIALSLFTRRRQA